MSETHFPCKGTTNYPYCQIRNAFCLRSKRLIGGLGYINLKTNKTDKGKRTTYFFHSALVKRSRTVKISRRPMSMTNVIVHLATMGKSV